MSAGIQLRFVTIATQGILNLNNYLSRYFYFFRYSLRGEEEV